MSTYKAPLDDMRFALFDVLGAEALFARLGFDDATRDVVDAVLDEAARFTETVLAPLNAIGDEIGCTLRQGHRRRAHAAGLQARPTRSSSTAAGPAWSSPVEFGGQGMPRRRRRAR